MTSGVSARGFMRGQAPFLRERGWDVALMCSDEGDVERFAAEEGLSFCPVPLQRNPSLMQDVVAASRIVRLLRRLRPDVAHWGSPKASLIGVIACRALAIPSIYDVHGLRLEGARGPARVVLTVLEAITCRLADVVVADGYGCRRVLERHRIMPRGRVRVLADGSCNGVDDESASPRYRARGLGLGEQAVIVTFAGRITRDKGVRRWPRAWREIAAHEPEAHLVIAGRADAPHPERPALVDALSALPRTHLLGHVDDLGATLGRHRHRGAAELPRGAPPGGHRGRRRRGAGGGHGVYGGTRDRGGRCHRPGGADP